MDGGQFLSAAVGSGLVPEVKQPLIMVSSAESIDSTVSSCSFVRIISRGLDED